MGLFHSLYLRGKLGYVDQEVYFCMFLFTENSEKSNLLSHIHSLPSIILAYHAHSSFLRNINSSNVNKTIIDVSSVVLMRL